MSKKLTPEEEAQRDSTLASANTGREFVESVDNMSASMMLSILETMGEQLSNILDTLQKTQPPGMSTNTYNKTLRDVKAQLLTIKWAHHCATEYEGITLQ